MNLGDLEFSSEDFKSEILQLPPSYLLPVAQRANRILREKLAKHPKVFAKDITPYSWQWETGCDEACTHRARLICIEELDAHK